MSGFDELIAKLKERNKQREELYTKLLVQINEPLANEVNANRLQLGVYIRYGEWEKLVEFWKQEARPAIYRLLRHRKH